MYTEVAAVLIDIEAALRQLDLWEGEPPGAEALASTQPFCIDTLSFPQWLQFVFIPRMNQLLEQELELPDNCAIAPMADEAFRGLNLPIADLLTALEAVDRLLGGGVNPR